MPSLPFPPSLQFQADFAVISTGLYATPFVPPFEVGHVMTPPSSDEFKLSQPMAGLVCTLVLMELEPCSEPYS